MADEKDNSIICFAKFGTLEEFEVNNSAEMEEVIGGMRRGKYGIIEYIASRALLTGKVLQIEGVEFQRRQVTMLTPELTWLGRKAVEAILFDDSIGFGRPLEIRGYDHGAYVQMLEFNSGRK